MLKNDTQVAMKKGSGTADSEGLLKFMVRIGEEHYRKLILFSVLKFEYNFRGGSKTAATSKMERFVIIFNGWKSLTITTKPSILDVAAVLESPLNFKTLSVYYNNYLWLSVLNITKSEIAYIED